MNEIYLALLIFAEAAAYVLTIYGLLIMARTQLTRKRV